MDEESTNLKREKGGNVVRASHDLRGSRKGSIRTVPRLVSRKLYINPQVSPLPRSRLEFILSRASRALQPLQTPILSSCPPSPPRFRPRHPSEPSKSLIHLGGKNARSTCGRTVDCFLTSPMWNSPCVWPLNLSVNAKHTWYVLHLLSLISQSNLIATVVCGG